MFLQFQQFNVLPCSFFRPCSFLHYSNFLQSDALSWKLYLGMIIVKSIISSPSKHCRMKNKHVPRMSEPSKVKFSFHAWWFLGDPMLGSSLWNYYFCLQMKSCVTLCIDLKHTTLWMCSKPIVHVNNSFVCAPQFKEKSIFHSFIVFNHRQ